MAKIAINGFGRIGRQVLRVIFEKEIDLDVAAINDIATPKTLAHLFKYDTAYRTFEGDVLSGEGQIKIGKKEIKVFSEKDPSNLPWKDLGVDVVLECTGKFTDYEGANQHIEAGAKKVIISAPSKSDNVSTFVLGVNVGEYNPETDNIVSMASCTTNCLAPMAKILNENFGIKKGFMTTIHAMTNDQKILDVEHKDLRRARTASANIIPTSTGAAKAIGKVIPELAGKLNGIAMRVPVLTGSIVDLVCEIEKEATAKEVNEVLEKAADQKEYKGIFTVSKEELVSSDFIKNDFSSIADLPLTMANGNMIKVCSWYDNEWGFSVRMAEFAEIIAEKI